MPEITTPEASVLMTVHNGGRHLPPALDSIIQQTFRDFEFIILDDASIDGTAQILQDERARDPRVRLLRIETNLGPYPSGNRGLDAAVAPIVARMDADDISAPDRLERQVAFLDANPDHLLVESGCRAIDDEGKPIYTKTNPVVACYSPVQVSLDHSRCNHPRPNARGSLSAHESGNP